MNPRTYMAVPRQLALDLDQEPSPLHGRTPRERFEVIALLAHLLLEASGLVDGEADDERV